MPYLFRGRYGIQHGGRNLMDVFKWLLGVVLIGLTACGGNTLRGGVIEPPQAAAELNLTDQIGRLFRLDTQRGHVVMIYFGYTYCPDLCPTTLADLAAARRKLGQDADRVQVVFISVDPLRDTPDKLGEYVAHFDPTFLALSGAEADLKRVLNGYQVIAQKRVLPDAAGYTIDHTSFTYVIDRHGALREMILFGAAVDDIANDMRVLLKE